MSSHMTFCAGLISQGDANLDTERVVDFPTFVPETTLNLDYLCCSGTMNTSRLQHRRQRDSSDAKVYIKWVKCRTTSAKPLAFVWFQNLHQDYGGRL